VEVATAVEPLKQLPQLVAAAAARVAAAAAVQQQQQQQQQQPELLLEGGMLDAHATAAGAAGTTAAAAAAGGPALDQELLLQELRVVVAGELAKTTQQIMSQQVWGQLSDRSVTWPAQSCLSCSEYECSVTRGK
jgi:hypothetical protein